MARHGGGRTFGGRLKAWFAAYHGVAGSGLRRLGRHPVGGRFRAPPGRRAGGRGTRPAAPRLGAAAARPARHLAAHPDHHRGDAAPPAPHRGVDARRQWRRQDHRAGQARAPVSALLRGDVRRRRHLPRRGHRAARASRRTSGPPRDPPGARRGCRGGCLRCHQQCPRPRYRVAAGGHRRADAQPCRSGRRAAQAGTGLGRTRPAPRAPSTTCWRWTPLPVRTPSSRRGCFTTRCAWIRCC